MAQITLGGNPAQTNKDMPAAGTNLSDYKLTKSDFSSASLGDYAGKRVILNIFPSIDTSVCATSVRTFNERVSSLDNTVVLCISRDLPFAHKRFCGAEGIENVETLSTFKNPEFAEGLGVLIQGSAFDGLTARSIIVLNEQGEVVYTQLVSEIGHEPDYDAAIASL